eukprot:scaffold66_cov390-Prasinococcus_capsulatus_cf.AAC.2
MTALPRQQVVKLMLEKEGQAQFFRFECNSQNKAIGKELEIKSVPTFILYKGGEQVARMSGAKLEKLKNLVEQNI